MRMLILNLKDALSYFLIICLANAPFWILGGFVFLNRPFFNYDIFLALGIMLFARFIGGLLLILTWAADGLVSQSLTYQFLSPIDFIESARFAGTVNWFEFISLVHIFLFVIFFMSVYLCVSTASRVTRKKVAIYCFLIVGLVLSLLDAANGASDLWRRDSQIIPINIAGSPEYTLIKNLLKSPEQRSVREIADDQSISKKFDILKWAARNPDRSILFVVVESLGIPVSKDAFEWLNNKVRNERFTMTSSDIAFRGATTSGELRSLCSLEGSYTSMTRETGVGCLPVELAKNNWQTLGFHGFSKKFFNREVWWPHVGFDKSYFVEDTVIGNLPRCGNVFRGACDKDVIKVAVESLKKGRVFAYVLTLNTHLPVVPGSIPDVLSKICARDEIPTGACTHIASLGEVLTQVAYQASEVVMPPLVVVVGDHAPPFISLDERRSFKQGVVPGYFLEPVSSTQTHAVEWSRLEISRHDRFNGNRGDSRR